MLLDGTYGFSSLSERTRKSNSLQSYFKSLNVGPAGGMNLQSPAH